MTDSETELDRSVSAAPMDTVVEEDPDEEVEDRGADSKLIQNPYGFAEEDASFGVIKKKTYFPKSNFYLQLLHFVSADHLTGFVCTVKRHLDGQERYTELCGMHDIIEDIIKSFS